MNGQDAMDRLRHLALSGLAGELKETDTIICLILPVLRLLGWHVEDPGEVCYTVPVGGHLRKFKDNYDVVRYAEGYRTCFSAVIECKAVRSNEFRDGTKPGDGVLTLHNGVWMQPGMERGSPNRDGLAQLRRYCANAGPPLDRRRTIPVLTNGKTWIGYRMDRFLDGLDAPVPECARLFGPISIDNPEFAQVLQSHLGRAALEERFRGA